MHDMEKIVMLIMMFGSLLIGGISVLVTKFFLPTSVEYQLQSTEQKAPD